MSAALSLIGGIHCRSGNPFGIEHVWGNARVFGFDLWIPIAYSWSTEHYPTRSRATGFAMVDGVGHLGGGIGVLIVVPFVVGLPVLAAFMVTGGFLVTGALVAQFGMRTRGLGLNELSP